ncbi:MAG TPA: iron-containing alcohol dehydrogenase [Gaiellales bacterium]|jgi:alcohol dehydrogenase|nr:iron-containing alcohol dehydrogenase [Gaiellales bacterium]
MVSAFRNHLPVKIRFGDGVSEQLAEVLESEGAGRPLVIVDEGLADLVPGVARMLDQAAGGERYVKSPGEPTISLVESVGQVLSGSGCDAVVAVGGGSTMDTAKAARLVAGQGGPYRRFVGGGVAFEPPAIPLVCVPTTAGTGSEVSGGAVITDDATHVKAGIAGPLLRAQHALVDPVLTHGLPPSVTAQTGIDALAQAIAAIVVRVATPIGDAIALESVRLAAAALPQVVKDGRDADARSRMACASLMAGLSMNISDCGSEHSLGQAIGGMFGLPHGLTIGLVLAETMDHDRHAVPERFARIAEALGEAPGEDGEGAIRGVRRILQEIEFPTLHAAGIERSQLDALADLALADGFIAVAPAEWPKPAVVDAYSRALELGDRR